MEHWSGILFWACLYGPFLYPCKKTELQLQWLFWSCSTIFETNTQLASIYCSLVLLSEQFKTPLISVGWGRRQWPWSSTGKDHQVSPTRHPFTVWTLDHTSCNSSHLASVHEYLVQTTKTGSSGFCWHLFRDHMPVSPVNDQPWLNPWLSSLLTCTSGGSLPVLLKNSGKFSGKVTAESYVSESFWVCARVFVWETPQASYHAEEITIPDQNLHRMTELLWPWCVSQALCKAVKEIISSRR